MAAKKSLGNSTGTQLPVELLIHTTYDWFFALIL